MGGVMGSSVPSRVLSAIEERARRVGHQNHGIVSASHGFLPIEPPRKHLPSAFRIWDELAAATPGLVRALALRGELSAMPVLDATAPSLSDEDLHRAALLLGFFAHAHARAERPFVGQDALPESILRPWATVCARLERPLPILTYFDLVAYNWRFRDDAVPERKVESMELLFPVFDCLEERLLYLTQAEMLGESASLVATLTALYDGMDVEDAGWVSEGLDQLTEGMHRLSASFEKITAAKSARQRIDPVVFAKTMMSFAVPIRPGTPGPGGTAFPTVHLLDVAFGRTRYSGRLGHEALESRRIFPTAIQQLFAALAATPVVEFVARHDAPALNTALARFMDAYVGPNGFLERHRRRVFGFLQTAFQVGRSETIGGYSGTGFDHAQWRTIHDQLGEARKDRTT